MDITLTKGQTLEESASRVLWCDMVGKAHHLVNILTNDVELKSNNKKTVTQI